MKSALASVVLWPLMLCIQVPLWVLGFPICGALAYLRAWHEIDSPHFGRRVLAWKGGWLTWLWGNLEDGVTGPDWWHADNEGKPDRWIAFVWSAWRNPFNNLRFVPGLNPVIDPARIRFVGNSDDPTENFDEDGIVKRVQWSWTWQGVYAGLVFRVQWTAKRHSSIRIGWKLLPRDRFGLPGWDYRRVRCPFAVQVHLWRKSK